MPSEDLFDSIRENLNGRPGQPMLLGVCQAAAQRFDKEVWLVRLAAIVLGVMFTMPSLIAYTVLGFLMPETEQRTRGVFRGLLITLREVSERLIGWFHDTFHGKSRRGGGLNG